MMNRFLRTLFVLTALAPGAVLAGTALAQTAGDAQAVTTRPGRIEIAPYGGYVWSRGRDVVFGGRVGTLATEASGMGGVAVGYDLRRAYTQLEFVYNRQQTELRYKLPDEDLLIANVTVEYFQIGGVFSAKVDEFAPFTSASFGLTRTNPDEANASDEWRFSAILGIGLKYFPWQKLGMRFQARLPFMITGDNAEVICIDQGCFKNTGGFAMWQFDLSAGLIIRL